MWVSLAHLFDASGFPPRWQCGVGWTRELGWLHILSDLGIWSAYIAIPIVLVFFAARRRDVPFRRVFLLFGAFILLCGTTHLVEAVIFWWPVYRLAGAVKLLTAVVSWGTVVALARVTPMALALRSPAELEREVARRTSVEEELRGSRDELELRVRERTAELVRANGQLRGEVAVRERVEAEVLRGRDELEQRVKERTAELSRSNQELQNFAYVASHDLQEPLRKIQSFGNLLVEDYGAALPDSGKDYVRRMNASATRMRDLIEDLLTLARVTSAARAFGPVDLGKIAREVASELEPLIRQVGGTVEIGSLPSVHADATQMRQLFQNLIANALKFHRPDAPPVIGVDSCPAPADSRPGWLVRVRDNGIGFDVKHTDRIFEVFQRLHGRDRYPGTGIGLAVCRRVAERHGGTITADSRPGVGSTFTVTLPQTPPAGDTKS